ncbi:trypsin-like peptidase domain-containing protein [Rhizobium sp. CFBP 13726]|uniref:phospholipase D-like domain-containing protein n=1 Tax=Rhizobium sp. CFBP 13726 TaxID=2775296 RepID=UPI001783D4A0|nr:phospholipase D-like domain-containing protein [Rhizobium sp. CFBP 13726]MBD8653951.1 trypsin-like peptidase domain-containing protein [Rhizobium sp. CFBP 13726]
MKELGKTLVEVNAKNLGAPYARDQELVKRLAAEQQATRYQCRIDERVAQTGAFEDIVTLPEAANPRLDFDRRFRPTALPNTPALTPVVEQLYERSAEQDAARIREESIALRQGRPVLAIKDGDTVLEFAQSASTAWREKLVAASSQLRRTIPSVGRVELTNYVAAPSVGTAWMIAPEVAVTNRHVAEYFVQRTAGGLRFLLGDDRRIPIAVDVDFAEEFGSDVEREFSVEEVIYLAPMNLPDIALLRIKGRSGLTPPPPLPLSKTSSIGKTVAVIGYPHRDPFLPEQKLMDEIFFKGYERKQIAPGFVMNELTADIEHDCSTLTGNSGSPVIDLESGEVVGHHRAGIFLSRNFAITPAGITQALDFARRPPIIEAKARPPVQKPDVATVGGAAMANNEVQITIPLTITVSLGDPSGTLNSATMAAKAGPADMRATPPRTSLTWEQIEDAVPAIRAALGSRRDVIAVKPGYRVTGGVMTKEPVVVVSVRQRYEPDQLTAMGLLPLPGSIDGYPIDVAVATLSESLGIDVEAASEAPWQSAYKKRKLKPITDTMSITLCASPDTGWPELKSFLKKVNSTLTVAMYDFGAPHVVEAVRASVKAPDATMTLVLQEGESLKKKGPKKDDLKDAEVVDLLAGDLKDRFAFSLASVYRPVGYKSNAFGLFESSYHIKVAVRDNDGFWLSSGNWQSSNQAPIGEGEDLGTPTGMWNAFNREWHAIVDHPGLARTFREHIEQDLADAKHTARPEAPIIERYVWVPLDYLEPDVAQIEAPYVLRKSVTIYGKIKVHPLLTPDNYSDVVLDLLERAKRRILFQNQTFKPSGDGSDRPGFRELIEVMLRKHNDPAIEDLRIIWRNGFDTDRQVTTNIQRRGFDLERVRVNRHCHTKGIIIDDDVVVIGSHNWSSQGVTTNCDASLIIYDTRAVRYFEDLFQADWVRSKPPEFYENAAPVALVEPGDESVRPRMIKVPLAEWLAEQES